MCQGEPTMRFLSMMNAMALFKENPDPSDDEILAYLSGNLCRCSGYEYVQLKHI